MESYSGQHLMQESRRKILKISIAGVIEDVTAICKKRKSPVKILFSVLISKWRCGYIG